MLDDNTRLDWAADRAMRSTTIDLGRSAPRAAIQEPELPGGEIFASPAVNTVILVEDDEHYRDAIDDDLAQDGFAVHSFRDGVAMLAAVADGLQADVVVVNWGLEAALGIDLIPQMRTRGLQWPVVFFTGRNSPTHEELAFRRGAEDFVDKARGSEVLAARLRRITTWRPVPGETPSENIFGCGRLVLRESRAYWNDVDVCLTLTEFKIAKLLASKAGSFVTYRALYDATHYAGFATGSGEDGYRTNVRSAVKRIRNKFKRVSPEFDCIQTYMSFGYRWEMPSA